MLCCQLILLRAALILHSYTFCDAPIKLRNDLFPLKLKFIPRDKSEAISAEETEICLANKKLKLREDRLRSCS